MVEKMVVSRVGMRVDWMVACLVVKMVVSRAV